jgi:hypothetical protein
MGSKLLRAAARDHAQPVGGPRRPQRLVDTRCVRPRLRTAGRRPHCHLAGAGRLLQQRFGAPCGCCIHLAQARRRVWSDPAAPPRPRGRATPGAAPRRWPCPSSRPPPARPAAGAAQCSASRFSSRTRRSLTSMPSARVWPRLRVFSRTREVPSGGQLFGVDRSSRPPRHPSICRPSRKDPRASAISRAAARGAAEDMLLVDHQVSSNRRRRARSRPAGPAPGRPARTAARRPPGRPGPHLRRQDGAPAAFTKASASARAAPRGGETTASARLRGRVARARRGALRQVFGERPVRRDVEPARARLSKKAVTSRASASSRAAGSPTCIEGVHHRPKMRPSACSRCQTGWILKAPPARRRGSAASRSRSRC